MYGNNYPNDYEDKNVVDSTAREVNTAGGNLAGQDTAGNGLPERNGSYHYSSSSSFYNGNSYGSAGSSAAGSRSDSGSAYSHNNSYGSTSNFSGGSGYTVNGQPEKKVKKEKKENKFWGKALASMALGLFFGLCAGVGFYAVEIAVGSADKEIQEEMPAEGQSAAAPVSEAETTEEADVAPLAMDHEARLEGSAVVMDVSDVAAQVMPAIVSINNTTTETISFFGRTLENQSVGAGSGIIVGENDTELLIVSNYHVVEDSDMLTVQFADGTESEAHMKGSNPDMDLAVIAVSLADVADATRAAIAVAALGDSDSLTVGEPAIAIGNALGYGQSVTTGVISALDRVIDLSSTGERYGGYEDASSEDVASFIQTDAAINPGNSGGALLNIKGEVIGINSNKIGGSAIEGMGYAIPISAARPIIEELMLRETRAKVGEENKGFLGITPLTVVDQMVEDYGMPKGVYVSQVSEGSAAAKAGIIKGNIITEFDGNEISSSEDLLRVMEYYAVGDVVEVVVMQGSPIGWESKTLVVILGARTE